MKATRGHQDGQRIRELRESQNLSVRELAEKVGVHPQTMRNVELGRGTSVGLLLQVASALGKQLPDILRDGDGSAA